MVWEAGSHNDSGVFNNTKFCDIIKNGELNIPPACTLPGDDDGGSMSYVFLGDEVFPLVHDLLQPYPRIRASYELTDNENNYNYRLS